MKCLNEPIARRANQEDQCTGHFWESRFKSQALLTEEALLSCMAYVDLNPVQPIARRANQEDQCTGHFWESRFKSQALLTEEALLSCMAYVDLNPVRANMAATPESSEHTSFKERLNPQFDLEKAALAHLSEGLLTSLPLALKPLAVFEGPVKSELQDGILFRLQDYLELVDYTGRILRDDKKGMIFRTLPPILDRLALQPDQWTKQCSQFEALYEKQFRRKRRYSTKQPA